jgi:hypothetical protein
MSLGDSDAKFSRGRSLNTIQQSAAIRQIDLGRCCAAIFAVAQTVKMRLICRWLIRFNTNAIGFAHPTAPETNPADRSEGESRRIHRARTPQTCGLFARTPQRRLRLRPHVHQPSGTRDTQSDREPIVDDCRRAQNSTQQAHRADGALDRRQRAARITPPRAELNLKAHSGDLFPCNFHTGGGDERLSVHMTNASSLNSAGR